MAIKISGFFGTVPRVAAELLPEAAAQTASNCKLTSGNIVPYPVPVAFDSTARTGAHPTLYALRNGAAYVWLSWATKVDIATPSAEYTDEQRFYYTGDGVPKVSTYALATSASAPYPNTHYDLGLPLPTAVATSAVTAFTTKSVSTASRDTNNLMTVVTTADHGLRTGNTVTITGYTNRVIVLYTQSGYTVACLLTAHGFSVGSEIKVDFTDGVGTSGTFTVDNVVDADNFEFQGSVSETTVAGTATVDFTEFNATNVKVTVTNSTTFTYSSVGTLKDTGSISQGSVDLDGTTTLRTYVYTWMTPWGEESIGSEPTADLYCKEGNLVTVSALPTAKPSGANFINGMRLYRTLTSSSGTDYIRLSTLWFPTRVTHVSRASNVASVRTSYPHMLIVGDRFKINSATDSTFNITGGIVTVVTDDNNFSFAQTDINVTLATDNAAMLFHDVAETPDDTARYWGDSTYDFADDFNVLNLTTFLATDEYSAPPEDLEGLISIQNNTLAGFVGKTLYFSEPKQPHAWPTAYAITLEYDIVALATIGSRLYVLTTSYPYAVDGGVPGNMAYARLDALYPCVSSASVVKMAYGVVYATHDGLAVISTTSNTVQLVTAKLHSSDTWNAELDPSTIVGVYYGDAYFGSHSTGAFVFQQDDKSGGYFVTTDYTFTAAWYDTLTNRLFYVGGTDGIVYEWDDTTQPNSTVVWKSKVMIGKDYMNLGAAKIVADFTAPASIWDLESGLWGAISSTWDASEVITFELWADKTLVCTVDVIDKLPFRLPTGYRTDTYEIRITSNILVRSVHLGENPLSLKDV